MEEKNSHNSLKNKYTAKRFQKILNQKITKSNIKNNFKKKIENNYYEGVIMSMKNKKNESNKKILNFIMKEKIINNNFGNNKNLNFYSLFNKDLKLNSCFNCKQIKNIYIKNEKKKKNNSIIKKEKVIKKKKLEHRSINYKNKTPKNDNLLNKINQNIYLNISNYERDYYFYWIKRALNIGIYFQIPLINNKYKFYISKGNNKSLIVYLLKKKNCWYETNKNDPNLNLYWSQKKDIEFLKTNEKMLGVKIDHEKIIKKSKFEKTAKINSTLKNLYNSLNIIKKDIKIHNHLPNNSLYGSKKNLKLIFEKYLLDNNYNVDNFLPQTFLLDNINNFSLNYFEEEFSKNNQNSINKNIWIIKPGENSNKGNNILLMSNLEKIKNYVNSNKSKFKSIVIQKYYEDPLLVNNRKFDLRIFCLLTNFNKQKKLYFYKIGYSRTCSFDYSLNDIDNLLLHLTNEAVQKKNLNFGKFEKGNKLKIVELIKIIKKENPEISTSANKLYNTLMDNIKEKIKLVFQSYFNFNDDEIVGPCFELFGFDFLLEKNLNPLWIEINYNPSLVTTSSLSTEIIIGLLDNVFSLVIDPFFPPKINNVKEKFYKNNFEFINLIN